MSSSARQFLLTLAASIGLAHVAPAASLQPDAAARLVAEAPLYFEANGTRAFTARGVDCLVDLSANAAVMTFASAQEGRPARAVTMHWLGSNRDAVMQGIAPLPGAVNYLVGTDRSQWRTGVPLFGKVRAAGIYPGVDLVYYADQHARLEYDLILQPGADSKHISFRVDGADSVRVNDAGELVIRLGRDEVRQHKPVLFQEINGARTPVSGGYRMISSGTVGFEVGAHDATQPLIIDPVLSFATYIGRAKAEWGWSIAVDSANNIYVAGETLSQGFASSPDVFQRGYAGGIASFGDAFVAKYDGATRELVYRTYLGGKANDGAKAVAVDDAGRAYVTGFTDSRNFPIVPQDNAMTQATLEGSGRNNNSFRIFPINAFVSRLNPAGTELEMSVLLGGRRRDAGSGIAVDADSGDVFVTGFSQSPNFHPPPTGFQTNYGGNGDAFVVRLTNLPDPAPAYSTYLGGTNQEQPHAIAVASGRAYVAGWTMSRNFPITNAPVVVNSTWTNGVGLTNLNLQRGRTFSMDAFVTALNPAGTELLYSTYLGGTSDDAANDIKVDASGNAYVAGHTYSRVFPTNSVVAPRSSARNFLSHAFVTKLNPAGALVYSAEFGSSRADQAAGIALDEARQQVFVTGFTTGNNFFSTNITVLDARAPAAIARRAPRTPRDGFLVALQETGGAAPLTFTNAVLFGGSGNDTPRGMAVGTSGPNVLGWIAGQTTSRNLPTTNSYSPSEVQERLGNAGKGARAADAFLLEVQFP